MVRDMTAPQNKELKLTKPCTIGASQLNSSVVRTVEWRRPMASMTTSEGYRLVYLCGAVFVGLGLGEALSIGLRRPPALQPSDLPLAFLEVALPAYLAVTESLKAVRLGWLLLAALGVGYWALGGVGLGMPWAFLFAALWIGAGAMLMWGSREYLLRGRMRL
jgi:hypothetical protein